MTRIWTIDPSCGAGAPLCRAGAHWRGVGRPAALQSSSHQRGARSRTARVACAPPRLPRPPRNHQAVALGGGELPLLIRLEVSQVQNPAALLPLPRLCGRSRVVADGELQRHLGVGSSREVAVGAYAEVHVALIAVRPQLEGDTIEVVRITGPAAACRRIAERVASLPFLRLCSSPATSVPRRIIPLSLASITPQRSDAKSTGVWTRKLPCTQK